MMDQTDTRTLLNAFFRHRGKFLFFFLPALLAGLYYVFYYAPPEYESTAKLLVKFGQDARPVISNQNVSDNSSADEHHELVQSTVTILSSRDLTEALLNNIGIAKAYPRLIKEPPERGTLMDAAVKHMSDDLIVKTEAESDLVTIGLYNTNPEMARFMLQQLLDLFIAKQSEIYSNPQTAVHREQADTALAKLENAQKQLDEYKKQTGIVSFDTELNLLLRQRSTLADELFNKERTYTRYQSPIIDAQPHAQTDPDVKAVRGQIGRLDREVASMTQRESHYEDLMREIKMDEDSYKDAKTRVDNAEANQSLNQQKITRISIIEHPALPYKPGRPWKAAIIALCTLVGLALGTAACILAERFDKTFSLPDQAAEVLGVPVLASFAYRKPSRKYSR